MSSQPRRALGRGLDALLPSVAVTSEKGTSYGEKSVFGCPIELLHPQHNQPRQRINDQQLQQLADSLKEHGLIEPLVVRRSPQHDDKFEIIAGERRWRAAQRAGLKELLVVVKDVTPNAAFELALIENLQREDLDPIEIAEAIERLIREHDYTHEMVASRLHKDRTTITNALRLLRLPRTVRTMVIQGQLSEGHARALLGASTPHLMEKLAQIAVRNQLSVRKVEALVRQYRSEPSTSNNSDNAKAPESPPSTVNLRALEQQLTHHLGYKVQLRDRGGKGEIAITYNSLDELDALLETLWSRQN